MSQLTDNAQHRQVMRVWYQYLQASDRSKWCKDLRDHFGPEESEPFEDWFASVAPDSRVHLDLCIEFLPDPAAVKLNVVSEFSAFERYFRIDLRASRADLLAAFKDHLDRQRKTYVVDRRRRTYPRAGFQPNGYVQVAALSLGLELLLHRKRSSVMPSNSACWAACYAEAEEARKAVGERPLWVDAVTVPINESNERAMEARVSRYVARAKEVLSIVPTGRFPCKGRAPYGEWEEQ